MTEWPYVMLCESLVFLLSAAGIVWLQNTLTGVAYYTFPVLVSSALGVLGLCWVLAVASLVLLASTDTLFSDGCAGCMLRGGRAACGVVLMHMAAMGGLCPLNTDPDMFLAMFSSNHLFPSDGALMYYLFAVSFALVLGATAVCALVAQHSMLRGVFRRTQAQPVARVSWNVNLVLVVLFETEVFAHHNAANAFAQRAVYVSWQTLIAFPALLAMDMLHAKFAVVPAVWAKLLGVLMHVLVVAAWAVLVLLHPVVRSRDTMYVNISAGALLLVCTVSDVANVLGRHSAPDPKLTAQNPTAPKLGERAHDLFDIPVRSGVQHSVFEPRLHRRPPLDLRTKKNV